jgi:hypothetical protein
MAPPGPAPWFELALGSSLTGRQYRLEPGAPFWVERQDGDLLLATGLCRPA